MIRAIYYFLSAFNIVLALVVIFNFSDISISIPLFESIKLWIPIIIINAINEHIVDLGLFFKNLLRKFIDWIYNGEIKLDPKKVKVNKQPKNIQNPFNLKPVDMEYVDVSNYFIDPDFEESTKTSW
jgi:hypothetical protein